MVHVSNTLLLTLVLPALSCVWPPSLGPCAPTTTTSAGPLAPEHQFIRGVVDALGYKDAASCFANGVGSVGQIHDIISEYEKGGVYNKAKALAKLAEEVRLIINTLEACTDATTDAEQYRKLMENLQDPRYYTLHNACTLALNIAEDRAQLREFMSELSSRQDYQAGSTLMRTILDVMENPGIPSSNGTASAQIARGFASGFVEDVELKCFQDAKVELPALVGGVLECMSGVGIIPGLESLFHGIEGLAPLLRDCYHDKSKILNLLHTFANFKDPHGLARDFGHRILTSGLDLSIELAQIALDTQGKEYERLGRDTGRLLGKVMLENATAYSSHTYVVV